MICLDKKVLFIHIPKCGGTHIEAGITPGVDWHARGEKHLSLKQSVQAYGEAAVRDCFRFSVVRNPFARVVSAYLYYQRHGFEVQIPNRSLGARLGRALGFRAKGIRELTFREFADLLEEPKHLVDWAANDLRTATSFCEPHQDISINKVYRLESFDECLKDIEALGFGRFEHLTKVNSAPTGYDYASYYCTQSTETVRKVYASDFASFYPEILKPSDKPAGLTLSR